MKKPELVTFLLDGKEVTATPEETIWDVANREGNRIPHLCHLNEPGYEPAGNCRACMVEVDNERVLAASCVRKVSQDMVVKTATPRAKKARKSVFRLLLADRDNRITSPDTIAPLWEWADKVGAEEQSHNPFPSGKQLDIDNSHPAITVNLNACIACGLCVRACRDVQHNDVIGLAYRGSHSKIVFDIDDDMGKSTCVGCGECVQACPTGALIETSLLSDDMGTRSKFPDKSVHTLCPYCGVGCQVTAHTKNNEVISVDGRNGPANQNRLCVKGRFGFNYIASKERLTQPLKRRKDAPKHYELNLTMDDIPKYFEEISWEQALTETANGFLDISKDQGPQALAGFGSAKGSNEEAYLFQKLIRTGFGTNNVDHCTRLCHASSVAALMENVSSGAVSAPFTAAKDADFIIVIGARPNVNHPVAASYIKDAAINNAKLVIMDPRKQALSRYAWRNLHFTPGRDVALLNAMLNVIITENLYDKQFIDARTSGFELLQESIVPYTPELMSEVCGIDPETIKEVARAYAAAKSAIIFWGMGVSQHTHGTDNARCLIALALITGQIGRPGSGLHPLRGQNNVQGASDAGLIPMTFPDYVPIVEPSNVENMQEFWNSELDAKPGLTVVEIINQAMEKKINGLYVMGENPAMSDPDIAHVRKALSKLDHLVVQDIFLTETAWFADIILPATALMEKNGTFTNTNRQIQMGRAVVKPPGNARPDLDIINEIGQKLGLPWNYQHPKEVFGEMCTLMDSFKNITWERVEKEDSVTYPCQAPDEPGDEIIFRDRFPTPDGLGRIPVCDLISPSEEPDSEYPLVLTTGRLLEHWHTGAMTRRATVLNDLEPIPHVHMNLLNMQNLDLKDDDIVRVKTRRGHVQIAVRQDNQVAQDMIFIPFCYREAAANILTNPVLDPYGKIPEFKYCAATIEKINQEELV